MKLVDWKFAEQLLERVCKGETIKKICSEPGAYNRTTIHNWMCKDPEFKEKMLLAIELRADHWVEEIFEVAADDSMDVIPSIDKNGNTVLAPNQARINRHRMQIDVRKWAAQKLYRKRYGDHQQVEHAGKVEGTQPILNVTIDGSKSKLVPETGASSEDEGE